MSTETSFKLFLQMEIPLNTPDSRRREKVTNLRRLDPCPVLKVTELILMGAAPDDLCLELGCCGYAEHLTCQTSVPTDAEGPRSHENTDIYYSTIFTETLTSYISVALSDPLLITYTTLQNLHVCLPNFYWCRYFLELLL